MNENDKVVIEVVYERDGIIRVCYGAIDEAKLEKLENDFYGGEEGHILMENNNENIWPDKESVFSIGRYGTKSTVFEKPSFTNNKVDTGICT